MSEPIVEAQLDLTDCAREPIHIPGSIQPWGYLLAVEPEARTVVQLSRNCEELFGRPLAELLGAPLGELLDAPELPETAPDTLRIGEREFELSFHAGKGVWTLELEPAEAADPRNLQRLVHEAVRGLRATSSVRDMASAVVRRVRALGGFDRVMLYRFLHDESGTVIAEDRRPDLEPYLGLHYPASDIPPQARALYVRNWLRLVFDVDYRPVPIEPTVDPVTGVPLDLSDCALRSVSPVHVQYLKNMGVRASMSVSLVHEGRLWGLIACHHGTPWHGGRDLRSACETIGQVASSHIASLEHREEQRFREHAQASVDRLRTRIAEASDVMEGLRAARIDLLDLTRATGAAILRGGRCVLVGATPSTPEIGRLAAWVGEQEGEDVIVVDSLAERFPEAARYATLASGLLAVRLARQTGDTILWFRPEVVETVTWAGDPQKPVEETPEGNRLRPRTSFAAWQETVRGRSRPWRREEVRAAKILRVAVMESELTTLNTQLEDRVRERTAALQKAVDELNGFTYSVSHDLRTPLRAMVGNSRILIEEHGPDLKRSVRDRLMSIEAAALKMANLVDDLLRFARLGRQELHRREVDLTAIARRSARRLAAHGWPCEGLDITVEEGLKGWADPELMEIVFTTLIENGCKYRTPEQTPRVTIGRVAEDPSVVYVRNEGIGFEMQYAERLFRPFERLHRDDEYPGTGIGLANAKRIIERHEGRIWAEGRPGEGATFFFALGSAGGAGSGIGRSV